MKVGGAKGKGKIKRETSEVEPEESEQGLGPQIHVDDAVVNKQTIVDNLSVQSVLAGRVFDMNIVKQPGMNTLHDIVVIQSWIHLFDPKAPVLYEEEVREFYYNIKFQEDGSIKTRVGNIEVYLDEELLGNILRVPREGIKSMVGKTCFVEFVEVCSKVPTTRHAGLLKKLMKCVYQLVF